MDKLPNLNERISKEEPIFIANAFLDSYLVAKIIINKLLETLKLRDILYCGHFVIYH